MQTSYWLKVVFLREIAWDFYNEIFLHIFCTEFFSYLFIVAIVIDRCQILVQAQKSLKFDLFAFGLTTFKPLYSDASCINVDSRNHSRMDSTFKKRKKIVKLNFYRFLLV